MNILGFISGSILAIVFGSIIAVIVLLVGIALFIGSQREKRERQIHKDMALLSDYFYDNFYGESGKHYRAIPTFEERRKFLQEECPEFWSALKRVSVDMQKEAGLNVSLEDRLMARYMDFRFLKWQDSGYALTFDEGFNLYAQNLPLDELQAVLDAAQAEKQERETLRAQKARELAAKRYKEAQERREREAAQKQAAKEYWDSLSDDEKKKFKDAKGASARKAALTKPTSTEYNVDALYPVIISTYFAGVLSPNSSDSITHCTDVASSSSHSSYDSGSSHSYDSSFSSFDGGGSVDCSF